jgi:hypothetical protein
MAEYSGTMVFYDSFIEAVGDGTIDLDSDTIKVALFTSSHTPAVTDTAYSGLSNEVASGNGYTTGGEALTNVVWSQTNGAAQFNADYLVFHATGGSIVARYYVLYSSTATGNDLILYNLIDYNDIDVTVADGNILVLEWLSDGIIKGSMSDA